MNKPKFNYLVSFNSIFEHDYTGGQELNKTLNWDNKHLDLKQEQWTVVGCVIILYSQSKFLSNLKEHAIKLNWMEIFGKRCAWISKFLKWLIKEGLVTIHTL